MNPTTILLGLLLSTLVTLCSSGGGLLLPMIPLATLTGHAGLYASSLTSAALMKLKAASAIAALAALTESGFHFKFGLGWPQHEHSEIHHPAVNGNGWGRKRRSVIDSLDQVYNGDQLGCGMRLVCELSSANFDELENDEKLILGLFGRDGKAPHKNESMGKLSYSYASLLGENGKDKDVCGRVYSRCPFDARFILDGLRSS